MPGRDNGRRGSGREPLRDFDPGLAVPQSKETDQPFTRRCRILTHRREIRGGLRVEHLLSCLVQFVQRACLPKLLCELRGGLSRRLGLGQQSDEFVRCDGPVVGAPHIRGEPKRFLSGA